MARWQDGKRYLTAAAAATAQCRQRPGRWRIVARQPVELAFAGPTTPIGWRSPSDLVAALFASALAWLAARLSVDLYALADAASGVEAGRRAVISGHAEQPQSATALAVSTGPHDAPVLLAADEPWKKGAAARAGLEAATAPWTCRRAPTPLTGLLNRRGFETQMAFAVALARRSSRPFSLITVDVDHFKRVNDTYGHGRGRGAAAPGAHAGVPPAGL